MSEPVDMAPFEHEEQTGGAPLARSPEEEPAARGAAALAVTAALAALSTGMAIVVALGGGENTAIAGDRAISIAFTTGALFGPAALAALLGARALLRHRPWAPLLLLVVGTAVATAGLVILTVTVSAISGGDNAPHHEFGFIFDQCTREVLVIVALMAALHALSGTLEAAAGIMGRHAARRQRAAV